MRIDFPGTCFIILALGIIIGNLISIGTKLTRIEKKLDNLVTEAQEVDFSMLAKDSTWKK